jgi:hypothetical protein
MNSIVTKIGEENSRSSFAKIGGENNRSSFAVETQEENLGHFLFSKAYDIFFENIPLEYVRTLPFIYAVSFGLFAYSISVAGLVFFTLTGYQQSMKEQFISLDTSAGACS